MRLSSANFEGIMDWMKHEKISRDIGHASWSLRTHFTRPETPLEYLFIIQERQQAGDFSLDNIPKSAIEALEACRLLAGGVLTMEAAELFDKKYERKDLKENGRSNTREEDRRA